MANLCLHAGGNIVCLDFWGRRCGPYIYTLHFCMSLGLLIGPFATEPLAHTPVPKIVQNMAFGMVGEGENVTTTTTLPPEGITTSTPLDGYPIRKIVKRSILNDYGRAVDRIQHKSANKATPHITPDPLLVQLFASTPMNVFERSV